MGKHATVVALSALEAFALSLAALFWFAMRPDLLATYGMEGGGPARAPLLAALALSSWLVPGAAGLGGGLTLAGLWPAWRTRTRVSLAGTGLVVTVAGVVFAVGAAYGPAFETLAP